jgi:hypothetical protein
MKNYKLIIASIFLAAGFSCTNPETYNAPKDLSTECGELTANKTVQSIAATSTTEYQYTADDVIEAYVTSSDEGGNFYKSLSLVSTDGTTGFSIPIDDYNLYTKYAPGRKVYLNLKDLYIVKDFGGSVSGTVIGSLYNGNSIDDPSDDEVGRLSIAKYKNVITASCSDFKPESELVQPMTIAQAKSEQNLNKLIVLDNVQFTDASIGNTYFDKDMNTSNFATATDHTIKDINDSSVIVRVSSFSTFATKPVPSTSGKIYGVMTRFGGTYQFMLRTERDVQLTNPRILPVPAFFTEPFTTNFSAWRTFSVTGTGQNWVLQATGGNPTQHAKMNGFSGGSNNANEDWLISPAQNLSSFTTAILSFETATNFTGDPLTVLISTNYSGTGNPSSATWTPLTATLANTNGGLTNWVNSGPININAYTGAGNNTVYVAFKYTSTTTSGSDWRVDNVKILAN